MTILNTFIHEATHVHDEQTNGRVGLAIDYWFQPHEMRARMSSVTFKVTREHTRWICNVVREVQKITGVR